jgi:transcriptional regulator with XRE-family HTH domain
MQIGPRLKELRESKDFSQGGIADAIGLARPYVSRVENGHTVPGIETLEKWARALHMSLYQILYVGDKPPEPLKLANYSELWGDSRSQALQLNRLRLMLSKMSPKRRNTLLALVVRMATRARSNTK